MGVKLTPEAELAQKKRAKPDNYTDESRTPERESGLANRLSEDAVGTPAESKLGTIGRSLVNATPPMVAKHLLWDPAQQAVKHYEDARLAQEANSEQGKADARKAQQVNPPAADLPDGDPMAEARAQGLIGKPAAVSGPGVFQQNVSPEYIQAITKTQPLTPEQQRMQAEQQRIADAQAVNRQAGEEVGGNLREMGLRDTRDAMEEERRHQEAKDAALAKYSADLDAKQRDLDKYATQDPDRFFKQHFMGPVGSRIGAAITLGLAGFAGPQTLKVMSDSIDEAIKNDMLAQERTYAHKRDIYDRFKGLRDEEFQQMDKKADYLKSATIAARNYAADRLQAAAASVEDRDKSLAAQQAANALRQQAAKDEADRKAAALKAAAEGIEKNRLLRHQAANAAASHAAAQREKNEQRAFELLKLKFGKGGHMSPGLVKENASLTAQRDEIAQARELVKDKNPEDTVPGFGTSRKLKEGLAHLLPRGFSDAAIQGMTSKEEAKNIGIVRPVLFNQMHEITGAAMPEAERNDYVSTYTGDGTYGALQATLKKLERYKAIKQEMLQQGASEDDASQAMAEIIRRERAAQ